MILDDLAEHLKQSEIAHGCSIFKNYDSSSEKKDAVVMHLSGSSVSDVGEKASVRVIVKSLLMQNAAVISGEIYELFYPRKQYQKLMDINGSLMYILASGTPYYSHRDESGRHNYIFDLSVVRAR